MKGSTHSTISHLFIRNPNRIKTDTETGNDTLTNETWVLKFKSEINL